MTNDKTISEEFEEIASSIPKEEWNKLPSDFATNFDHYVYGAPIIKTDKTVEAVARAMDEPYWQMVDTGRITLSDPRVMGSISRAHAAISALESSGQYVRVDHLLKIIREIGQENFSEMHREIFDAMIKTAIEKARS